MSVFRDVLAFMEIGHPDKIADGVGEPTPEIRALCKRLVDEEHTELGLAYTKGDLPEMADAIADSIWVLLCLAYAYGFPIEAIWEEVARTNMAKFPGGQVLRRADGKVCKPEGWKPPDVKDILERLGAPQKCTFVEDNTICGKRRNASVHCDELGVAAMRSHSFTNALIAFRNTHS